jgi:hypothetical protein
LARWSTARTSARLGNTSDGAAAAGRAPTPNGTATAPSAAVAPSSFLRFMPTSVIGRTRCGPMPAVNLPEDERSNEVDNRPLTGHCTETVPPVVIAGAPPVLNWR